MSPYFFAALTFAHRARAAARMRAMPAAEMRRLVLGAFATALEVRFCLAHRALCAAAIFRRAAADIVQRPDGDVVEATLPFKGDKALIAVSKRSRSC
jgi:hypothetical protein